MAQRGVVLTHRILERLGALLSKCFHHRPVRFESAFRVFRHREIEQRDNLGVDLPKGIRQLSDQLVSCLAQQGGVKSPVLLSKGLSLLDPPIHGVDEFMEFMDGVFIVDLRELIREGHLQCLASINHLQ